MHGRVLVVAGLRFRRRGGHPGRYQDDHGARRLRGHSDHCCDGTEHLGVAAVHLLPADLLRLQMTLVLTTSAPTRSKSVCWATPRRSSSSDVLAAYAWPVVLIQCSYRPRLAIVGPGCVGRVATSLAADGDRRHPQCAGSGKPRSGSPSKTYPACVRPEPPS